MTPGSLYLQTQSTIDKSARPPKLWENLKENLVSFPFCSFTEVPFVAMAIIRKSGKSPKGGGEAGQDAYHQFSNPVTRSLHPWIYRLICSSRSAFPVGTGTRFSASSKILRDSCTSLHASLMACWSEYLFSIARTGTMLSIWLSIYRRNKLNTSMCVGWWWRVRTSSLRNDMMSLILGVKNENAREKWTCERYGQMY